EVARDRRQQSVRLCCVGGSADAKAAVLEVAPEEVPQSPVVIDDEYVGRRRRQSARLKAGRPRPPRRTAVEAAPGTRNSSGGRESKVARGWRHTTYSSAADDGPNGRAAILKKELINGRASSLRRSRRFDLARRTPDPVARRQDPCSIARPPLRKLRLRG